LRHFSENSGRPTAFIGLIKSTDGFLIGSKVLSTFRYSTPGGEQDYVLSAVLTRLPIFSVEITEIENALAAFKTEVASGAYVGKLPYARLVKE